VSHVVTERAGRMREAERSVADSLAAAQTLLGPVLLRPCTESWPVVRGEDKSQKQSVEQHRFTLRAAPRQLEVNAGSATESRNRGIYKVNAYTLKADITARWGDLSALQAQPSRPDGTVVCEAPVLMLAVGDTRGIRSVELKLSGETLAVLPGSHYEAQPRGFHAVLPASVLSSKAADGLRASVRLGLVGTRSLAFAPIADENDVQLASDWPHPSFTGRFLPASREVGDKGFSARWQLSSLATTAQAGLAAGRGACGLGEAAVVTSAEGAAAAAYPCVETFGVAFIDPVNPYVLSDRATKYGLLLIGLTFFAVGLLEVMRRLRVHPIQYLLVGSALVIFFLLLVSLSEAWPFALAYAAAASACTALLGYYASHVLAGWRAGLGFAAGMTALFGVLYLLLQMEQGSLIIGSVLLFAVLGTVMVATRRMDWYALADQIRGDGKRQGSEPVRT
jgi:inner membrane protein